MAREGTGRVKERRRRREGKSFEFPVANKEWQTQAVCAFREGREVSTLPPPLSPFVPCSLSKPLLSSLFPPPATERARAEWRPALLLGKLVFVSPPPPTPLSNYVGGFLTQSSISPPPSPPRHRRPPLSISLAVKIASLFSPFSQRSHNPQFRSLLACFSGRLEEKGAPERKGQRRLQRRVAGYLLSHPTPLFPSPHPYIPLSTPNKRAPPCKHIWRHRRRRRRRRGRSSLPPLLLGTEIHCGGTTKERWPPKERPQQHNTCVCVKDIVLLFCRRRCVVVSCPPSPVP